MGCAVHIPAGPGQVAGRRGVKRGPKVGSDYVVGRSKVSREVDDLAGRRTLPFLDRIGLDCRPISFLLKEAYLQGIKDAADAMSKHDT